MVFYTTGMVPVHPQLYYVDPSYVFTALYLLSYRGMTCASGRESNPTPHPVEGAALQTATGPPPLCLLFLGCEWEVTLDSSPPQEQ